MILGVDHIALSCENVIEGSKVLQKVGYQVAFIDQGLCNDPSKKRFLKGYEPSHSLGYCPGNDSIAVELTQHSSPLCSAVSPYQVLLNCPPDPVSPVHGDPSRAYEIAWSTALGCPKPVAAVWEPFRAQVWYNGYLGESSIPSIRAILVSVSDLAAGKRFWTKGLGSCVTGAGVVEEGHQWAKVSFRAPFHRWSLDVVLLENGEKHVPPYLDDAGFCCLGLITNRLAVDCEAAIKAGGQDVGQPFTVLVGGKTLEIIILRGQANELVELIEFKHS